MVGRAVVIELIALERTVNDLGDWVIQEVRTPAYAEEKSVSQNEFYQGMATGFKPETKFILANWLDYHGEEVIEYTPFGLTAPVRLRVLRTYNAGDSLELTCYKDNEVKDGYSQSTDQD